MIRSKPANKAYLDNWEANFGELSANPDTTPTSAEPDMVPMPEDRVRHNGSGTPCDMLKGPCACGAWHTGDEPTEAKP